MHLPLLIGLTAIGAATLQVVAAPVDVPAADVRWLLTGAVATVSIAIGAVVLMQEGTDGPEHHPVMWGARVVTVAGALLLGLLGDSLTSVALMAVLLALVVGQLVSGVLLTMESKTAEAASSD